MDTYIVRVEYNEDIEPHCKNYVVYADTFSDVTKFIMDWAGDIATINNINVLYYSDMPYIIDDDTYFDIMRERG